MRALLLACLVPLAACEHERETHSYATAPAATKWQSGAATERNIAVLADDPMDLDLPRRETPRDAARRDAVLSAYRSGGETGTGVATAHRTGGQP